MEVEDLIDAGFLSLAKKLYIENEKAVEYILSEYVSLKRFLSNLLIGNLIGFSGSSHEINLTNYEITTTVKAWSKQSLSNLCQLIERSKLAFRNLVGILLSLEIATISYLLNWLKSYVKLCVDNQN